MTFTTDWRAKLRKAVEYHYCQLDDFRSKRTAMIEQYAGSVYSRNEPKKTLLNLMMQAAQAHVMGLAANMPRGMVTARTPTNAAFARQFSLALNRLLKDIHFDKTLQAIALDSFFGPGICKVYLGDSEQVIRQDDIWMDPGQPFVQRISMDDFVYDTKAEDFRKATFYCDRYRLPLAVVDADRSRFPRGVADVLYKTDRMEANPNEASHITIDDFSVDEGDLEEMIDLVDVYLPQEKTILTFASDDKFHLRDSRPLHEQDWEGAETGPYKMLNLAPVPDNCMPSSPAMHIKWLDELANELYRKLARQAQRAKTIGIVTGNGADDAERLNSAPDGSVVSVESGVPEEHHTGVVDNNVFGFAMNVVQTLDRNAGNLAMKAGLGATTDTLGQDQILAGQVNRMEAHMQSRMVSFTEEVLEELARMLFDDPVREYTMEDRRPGLSFPLQSKWETSVARGDRFGKWDDYEYRIEPYSQAYKSPSQRLQAINQVVGMVMPFLPILQQQGVEFSMADYMEIAAELSDEPRLLEIFKTGRVPMDAPQGGGHERSMPSQTERTYTRRNVSSGRDANMSQIQQLMSSSNN